MQAYLDMYDAIDEFPDTDYHPTQEDLRDQFVNMIILDLAQLNREDLMQVINRAEGLLHAEPAAVGAETEDDDTYF